MDEHLHNRRLALLCLQVINNELSESTPGTGYTNRNEIGVPKVADHLIPEHLKYACRFWVDHLQMLPWDEELFEKVKVVIYDKLLFWLEVLSVIGEVYSACTAITTLRVWCQVSHSPAFSQKRRLS